MTELMNILMAYPRFVIEFFLLRGFSQYERAGNLSGALIVYFLTGLALALAVGIVNPTDTEPFQETDPRVAPRPAKHPAHRFSGDIIRLTIVIVGGSLILHALMLLYSDVVENFPLGGALDTVNAALGYGAVYLPLHAVLTRTQQWIARRNRERDPRATKPFTVALGIFQFLFPIFFLIALGQVYGTPTHTVVRPAIVSAIGTIVALTGIVAIVLLILRGNPPVRG